MDDPGRGQPRHGWRLRGRESAVAVRPLSCGGLRLRHHRWPPARPHQGRQGASRSLRLPAARTLFAGAHGEHAVSRASLVRLFAAIFVLQGAWVAWTQNARTPIPFRTERVKADLYMVSGEGGNVAVDVTAEGVVLVDDMFDRNHADILSQVKTVTDKPLRYVFNTHQHDDHAGGDARMLPIAEVIAHRNARANLVAKKQPYYEDTPGTPIGLPRITFTDETSLHLGGRE